MKNKDNEAIIEEFNSTFPGMTVSDVNKQLDKITNKCLERFNDV